MMLHRHQALAGFVTAPVWVNGGQANAAAGQPLWLIETGGARVYLTGHTPPRPMDWSDARLEGLLKSCGSLWNETNQSDHSDVNGLVQRYGMDQARPLQDWLTPADKDRLETAARLAGAPVDEL